ncbi:MAG TPA: hypothetical protein O0X39_04205 [Methanocorpusculum sp.]|nr:hypothetical protein [Methanocorpusculum sp.]
MAGPYHITLEMKSGRSVDLYAAASAAVGTNLPCEKLGDAISTSPDSFVWDIQNDAITDVFFGCSSGAVELIREGNNTGVIFRAAQNQASQAGRKLHNVALVAGATYRVKVVSAIPA